MTVDSLTGGTTRWLVSLERRGQPVARLSGLGIAARIYVFLKYSFDGIRVPTPSRKSWIIFLEISRTWKVLENHFGPGKS